MLDGELFHMRCCAHILNLIVQDGMSVIASEIAQIRGAVSFWKGSPKREQRFDEACRQLGIQTSKKLILDCKTRWNAGYEMLSVALLYKDVFTRLKNRDPLYTCVPTAHDWNMAKIFCDKLSIFYEATKEFSGTRYPTANLFFPTICSIRIDLAEWIHDEYHIVKAMASKMIDKYNKYWSVVHGVMAVATVLDPRYKMGLLDFYFPRIYSLEKCDDEIRRIKRICSTLYDEYKERDAQRQSRQASDAFVNPNSINMNQADATTTKAHMAQFDMFMATRASTTHGRTELDIYLEEVVLPRSEDFDVLGWWKSNGTKYPILQNIAKDILAIPVSTVASESAFSTGGRVVSKHRSRLLPNTLEALMCAQNWLWNDIRGDTTKELQTMEDDIDEDDTASVITTGS